MDRVRIGLIPLYLALYDVTDPQARPGIDAFAERVAEWLSEIGPADRRVEVVTAPVCRVREEFARAVDRMNAEEVCLVVTVHLAYSPSLESAQELLRLKAPILVLDTTPDAGFGPSTQMEAIMYNHGIHGVQDLCSLLKRNHAAYAVEAGHLDRPELATRVQEWIQAATAAQRLQHARVGIVGHPFDGMGDFQVSRELLQSRIGMTVVDFTAEDALRQRARISQEAVCEEICSDLEWTEPRDIDPVLHETSTTAGLVLRGWMEEQHLTGLTVNFMDLDDAVGLETMPVLEIDKAMLRGIGYAGEGDVLTAGFCGALHAITDQLTFTEMFCPDWQGESVFLSHMAEGNPVVFAGTPFMSAMPFPYTKAADPVFLCGRYRAGSAVLANLAPDGEDGFRLVLVSGHVLDVDGPDALAESVHGWFCPERPLPEMLRAYSLLGGTHHSVLLYGDVLEPLRHLGALMQFETHVL